MTTKKFKKIAQYMFVEISSVNIDQALRFDLTKYLCLMITKQFINVILNNTFGNFRE